MSFNLELTLESEKQIKSIMNDPSKKGLQKQIKKALGYLKQNPRHPSLQSHILTNSEKSMGIKIWTSYVQNKTPQAHRILWTYGKTKNSIVILAVIPHY